MPPGRKREDVDDFLHGVLLPTVELLPYDAESAALHATERARLERAGQPVPFVDGMIAAIAARFGLTLVTRNVADFSNFAGLQVEDWHG
jgi:tRNA(fMet)-specific endonuclease VapC